MHLVPLSAPPEAPTFQEVSVQRLNKNPEQEGVFEEQGSRRLKSVQHTQQLKNHSVKINTA